MSIKFFDQENGSNNFYGWKVKVFNGRTVRNKSFSARPPDASVRKVWKNYQETRARHFEALCMKNAAAVKYLKFVSTSHPLCKPKRGVGVHGITMSISEQGDRASCGFVVYMGGAGNQKRFLISEDLSFSAAWERAVNLWSESHSVRPKDRDRVLRASPGPESFRELRRQMNLEGHNINPDGLWHVFSEKRAMISDQRKITKPKTEKVATQPTDIEAWFRSEIEKTV